MTFIIALFEAGCFWLSSVSLVIALGLDLGDLGINACGLFALRDRDLIFKALEGFLAGFFIHIGDDVLCEVQHTVQVAA